MKIIGIDVGGTKILGIRADAEGNIARELRVETRDDDGLEAVVDRIAGMVRDLMPPDGDLEGVGVGIPGPLNPATGIVYNPPNLAGWETVPLRDMLRERLDLPEKAPIVLVNDANAAALSEYRFGAGRNAVHDGKPVRHLVYLTISTGIGGGVISDGKLLSGATGMAAELGHLAIDLHGPRCFCGGIGHLEAMASGTALAREGYMVVAARRKTTLVEKSDGDPDRVTAEMVVEAAKSGDKIALSLMEREAFIVGVGVVSCIHAFNPQLIVIGGGVAAGAGDLLFKGVQATVEDRLMPGYENTYKIVPAALGHTSGALGAVAAVLEEF